MGTPQVSVVMGVYNAEACLQATLDSVLTQDCDLEFIVVDDGSTDGTADLLRRAAHADARLRVISQPNAGLTRALIAGCAAARAPLIARQDAGDLSLPGRLRREVEAFQADPSLAFVSCATEYVEPHGCVLYTNAGTGMARSPARVIDLHAAHGMSDGPSHHGAVTFSRSAYEAAGGYRPEFYFGQDWDLWYRLAERGSFLMLPDILYRARVAAGDISTTRKPQQERLAALSLRAMHERARGISDAATLREAAQVRPVRGAGARPAALAQGSYFIGECLRRRGERERAADYFHQAIAASPLHLKAWLRLAQLRLAG